MSLAKEFIKMLNDYHLGKEIYDDALEIEMLKNRISILENPKIKFPPTDFPYFSPSSASSMDLELYAKLLKWRRDESNHQAHQRRWTKIGTKVGDTLQEDLVFIEKHVKNAPFIFERTSEGYPAYEDYIKTATLIHHKGRSFYLYGRPDGILNHVPSGQRIGLECKSKSTTYSKTGDFSMKGPSDDHKLQCVCYSLMYGTPEAPLDKFLITYWNVSKKSWVVSPEDLAKYPDVRVFEYVVTEQDKQNVLDKFVSVLDAADAREKPEFDIEKFTFCNFKGAIVDDMSVDDISRIKRMVDAINASKQPEYVKNPYNECWAYISERRGL